VFYTVSYDISDDKRRRRVAKTLQEFGYRVQYSVFECRLVGSQLAELRLRLNGLVDINEDSIRIYPLCNECLGKVKIIGYGEVSGDVDAYVV